MTTYEIFLCEEKGFFPSDKYYFSVLWQSFVCKKYENLQRYTYFKSHLRSSRHSGEFICALKSNLKYRTDVAFESELNLLHRDYIHAHFQGLCMKHFCTIFVLYATQCNLLLFILLISSSKFRIWWKINSYQFVKFNTCMCVLAVWWYKNLDKAT